MQFNQLRHTARLATQHVMKSQVATSIISGPANVQNCQCGVAGELKAEHD